jgi:hypothetical protein
LKSLAIGHATSPCKDHRRVLAVEIQLDEQSLIAADKLWTSDKQCDYAEDEEFVTLTEDLNNEVLVHDRLSDNGLHIQIQLPFNQI